MWCLDQTSEKWYVRQLCSFTSGKLNYCIFCLGPGGLTNQITHAGALACTYESFPCRLLRNIRSGITCRGSCHSIYDKNALGCKWFPPQNTKKPSLSLPLFFTCAYTLQEFLLQQVHLEIKVLLKQNWAKGEGDGALTCSPGIPSLFFITASKKAFPKLSC